MSGVVHLPLDGQLSGSKGELNRVHPNLRAKEAAMPRRKFVPQRLTSVPLAPPPSVRLGPLTQRLLSGAHWRGLDEFPFWQVGADDVEHVLRFLESEGRLATFLDVVQGVRTPQHRNACLAEARAACHLSRNGFRIVQWEPRGQGRTKGEIMVSLPGSPDIFVEVKHPGWQGEYRHRRIAEMGKLTPQQEEQCVARMKQGKYLAADGGRVAPHVAAMDVVRRNALPKLTDQCPNLVIVVDDLQVSPVGLPSLADLVEREFSDPDHDPGDPDNDLTGPVDVSDVDRRVFYLRFEQIEPDQRWTGPTVRTLELRTSLISFTYDPDYDPWLLHVVDGFLDSEEVSGLREAYAVERAPRARA